jgi:hypothetical protein
MGILTGKRSLPTSVRIGYYNRIGQIIWKMVRLKIDFVKRDRVLEKIVEGIPFGWSSYLSGIPFGWSSYLSGNPFGWSSYLSGKNVIPTCVSFSTDAFCS